MSEVRILVAGSWCALEPDIESAAHASALGAVPVDHPRFGVMWAVPRSFPMIVAPAGTIDWAKLDG